MGATTTIHLGDLEEGLRAAAAAAGVGLSTWLRDLARRELSRTAPQGPDGALERAGGKGQGVGASEASEGVYRAWLDAGLTAKLDRLVAGGGYRTRAAALRALLEGVNLGSASGSMTEAVQQLTQSNHLLVSIARDLARVARALQAEPGDSNLAQRLALERAVSATHQHVQLAAQLVAQLRPMLKTPGVSE